MEDERNTQLHQGEEAQEMAPADQVEVKDRGVLDSLLGKKKPEEKKPEDELVTGMQNVKVSEPEKHEEKEEHHEGGEKKESLLSKLHRSSSSSSSSSSDEEEEVTDENGQVVKRKKKKGLKEKIKGKLPGGHKEGDQKPDEHKAEAEHKPYTPNDDHKAYITASAPATTTGTTANVHHDDNVVVVQNVEETPGKGLLEKIKEKLPGGHKKTAEEAAATEEVSSPDAKVEKKQGFLGKIMDKIPGYNKGAAEEEHKPAADHKAST